MLGTVKWTLCRLIGGFGLIAAFALSAAEPQAQLHGTWVATKAERDGKAADDVVGHRIAFAGNRFQIHSKDGKLLWDFGHRGPRPVAGQTPPPIVENNQQTDVFPTGISQFTLDEDAREIYIAHWKRILVYDYDGKFKRGWGGKGMPLSQISNAPTPDYDWKKGPPPDQDQLSTDLHCIHLSVDGLVYVCDRQNNRVQVFSRDGEFKHEFRVEVQTLANGSVWDMVLSHDPAQRYLYVADGANGRIYILRRSDGRELGSFGRTGRMPGEFKWIHNIAIDRDGNLFTSEVGFGRRVQKFARTGGAF